MNAPTTAPEAAAHKVLVAAKALIADEASWAQRAFARNSVGYSVTPTGRSACKFCSLGAVLRASGQPNAANLWAFNDATNALNKAARDMGTMGAASLNDNSPHSVVLQMFDLAIEATKGTI